MKRFPQGKYLGTNKSELFLDGIVLSETVYETGFSSDWHRHDNAYFAFVMSGGCVEKRLKESVECSVAKFLFYNREEPHRNSCYLPGTRIFNIEFSKNWHTEVDDAVKDGGDIIIVDDPDARFLLLKIYNEYRSGITSAAAVESMALQLLCSVRDVSHLPGDRPRWLTRLNELLADCWDNSYSLRHLSEIVKVHPVTISRYFPKYMGCTLGEYIRKIRINRSLSLIKTGKQSLTDIALTCGFGDQSHFIRAFKKETGIRPGIYKAF